MHNDISYEYICMTICSTYVNIDYCVKCMTYKTHAKHVSGFWAAGTRKFDAIVSRTNSHCFVWCLPAPLGSISVFKSPPSNSFFWDIVAFGARVCACATPFPPPPQETGSGNAPPPLRQVTPYCRRGCGPVDLGSPMHCTSSDGPGIF